MSQLVLLDNPIKRKKRDTQLPADVEKKLDAAIPEPKKVSERVRYPWDEWFGKDYPQEFVLKKDVDFFCRAYTMDQMIRTRATKEQKRVSIKIAEDGKSLRVRIYNRDE